ncbi:MAG: hypothetical protein JNK72_20960 [Myxococcales bacterium]|nr:hypothetical protein [Myxococcales bacterium]
MRAAFRGLGASPGRVDAVVAIGAEAALSAAAGGARVALFLHDSEVEDTPAIRASAALVTASGGLTSDAAIVARALGVACVTGCTGLRVGLREGAVFDAESGAQVARDGDPVQVDGRSGEVLFSPAAAPG